MPPVKVHLGACWVDEGMYLENLACLDFFIDYVY